MYNKLIKKSKPSMKKVSSESKPVEPMGLDLIAQSSKKKVGPFGEESEPKLKSAIMKVESTLPMTKGKSKPMVEEDEVEEEEMEEREDGEDLESLQGKTNSLASEAVKKLLKKGHTPAEIEKMMNDLLK